MVEIKKQIDQFVDIYTDKIYKFNHTVERQLNNISVKKNSLGHNYKNNYCKNCVKINITDHSMVNFDIKDDIFYITINIDFNEVIALYQDELNDFSIFECFCKIVTHSMLHILMGHYNTTFAENIHKYACGLNYYISYFYTNDFTLIFHPDLNDGYKINKNFDPIMLNMASDMEINPLINLNSSFSISPKSANLPNSLTAVEYYSIIYNCLNSFPKNELKTETFCSCGIHNYLSDHFLINRNAIKEIYLNAYNNANNGNSMNNFANYDTNFGIKDIRQNAKFKNLQSNVCNFCQKMKISKIGIWKDFHSILNEITKTFQKNKISMVKWESNWQKFNNRKDQNDLIYPGRTQTYGNIEIKLAQKNVIFVDISSSMNDVIEPLFSFCYFALSKLNVEIVFYNTEISMIFDSASKIKLEPFIGGGTNVERAINQYEEQFGKITNIFVFTDGFDTSLKRIKNRATIYKITKNNVKRMI